MYVKHSYLIVFWRPFPISGPDPCQWVIASFFQKYGEIQCLNCREDRDPRAVRLMRQADLVVIAVRQSHRELCDLFCQRQIRFANCVYLITDYVAGGGLDLPQIAGEFRIPTSRLACIPYSPRTREAKKWSDTALCSPDFRRELNHTGQMMLRALGF